jgi:CHASE2 domain-containing sensor protein
MKDPHHKQKVSRAGRFRSHFTKYLYERDTIFATFAVFIFLILLGLIPINFYVLNPLKLALKDFDFNDMAYAKLEKSGNTPIDSNISIINIGHADREEIAYIIEKVSSLHPKVIGLDAYFESEKDLRQDSLLRNVIEQTKNLVVVSRLAWEKKKDAINVLPDYFDSAYSLRGYANFPAEEIGTVRVFAPFEKIGGKKYPHFTSAIVKEFDNKAYQKMVRRGKEVEIINYSRRVHQYQVIEPYNLMEGSVEDSLITGKIVLIGYVNPDPNDIEDKKFTPMNPKFAGKAVPDMNGVVVHANIISMVLEANYVKKMPNWFAWLVAVIIGWLHMSLFLRYYLEDHIWFHLVAKLAQVISAIFFAYLGILIFDKFAVKLDMKYTLYVIILAVDIIYFYEAFAVWMHKKFGFKTVFHQHHHG